MPTTGKEDPLRLKQYSISISDRMRQKAERAASIESERLAREIKPAVLIRDKAFEAIDQIIAEAEEPVGA